MTVAPWILEAHKSGEWLKTRGNSVVRIICTDAPGDMPVIAIDQEGDPMTYTADGKFGTDTKASRLDILPPPREWEVCVMRMCGSEPTVIFGADLECYKAFGWTLLARGKLLEGDGLLKPVPAEGI